MDEFEPITLVGIVEDEVGGPDPSGGPGSGLYAVPFQLSRTPSARWADLAVAAWDHPPRFTSMHRPGIAHVTGDRFVLDGTAVNEVERYHRDTLKLVIEEANKQELQALQADAQRKDRVKEKERAHREDVTSTAERIKKKLEE